MATFKTNTSRGYYGILTVAEKSQSIPNNTTTVSYTLKMYSGGYDFSGHSVGYQVYINGKRVAYHDNSNNHKTLNTNSSITLCSGTAVVPHDNTGYKTLSVSCKIWMETSYSYLPATSLSKSGTMDLTDIARVSDLSLNKTSIIADGKSTIVATAKKTSDIFTDVLTVAIGEHSKTIEPDVGFTIPVEWCDAIPGTSALGRVKVTTYLDGEAIGSEQTNIEIIVPDSVVPVIKNINVSEAVSAVTSAFGNRHVQNLSQLNISIDAEGAHGSTVNSYTTILEGMTYIQQAFTTNVIKTAGKLTGVVSITDSRNRTYTKQFEVNVFEYEKPTVGQPKFQHIDSDSDGDKDSTKVTISYKAYDVDGQNSKSLKLLYKKTTDEGFTERLIPITAWEGTVETTINGTDPSVTYTYAAELTDKIATSSPASIATGIVVMSRKAGGTGITFFGEAEEDGLVVKGYNPLKFTDEEALAQTKKNLGIGESVDVSGDYLPLTGGILTGPLDIRGTAESIPLRTRGIVGSDGNGNVEALYLQYGANHPVHFGVGGSYTISADGSTYSGIAAKAISDANGNIIANTYAMKSELSGYALTGHNHDGTYLPLSGGTMTGPLVISGGDAVSGKGNIQLDSDGQITAKGTTATLFGKTSGSSNLLVGHSSHALLLRGSATRPTYNGGNLALYSDLSGYLTTSGTAAKATADGSGNNIVNTYATKTELAKKANDFTVELYNGNAGNPKPVKFATVNYSTCDSNNGVSAKISMVSGHGNGVSYVFLQDVIINVGYSGTVTVDNFKYFGAETPTYDSAVRQYGDVFYVIDTTNKIVDFYCLMGQYARVYQTPWKRLTYSSGGTLTQHTSCTVYSSGTKVWANNSEYATLSDLSSYSLTSHSHDGATIRPMCIELNSNGTLSGYGGFIDFHFNGNTADYTSRIIENASGTLSINGVTITSGKVVTATTFSGALSGNATSATKATQDGNGNNIASTYLPLTGGDITNSLSIGNTLSVGSDFTVWPNGHCYVKQINIPLTSNSNTKVLALKIDDNDTLCVGTSSYPINIKGGEGSNVSVNGNLYIGEKFHVDATYGICVTKQLNIPLSTDSTIKPTALIRTANNSLKIGGTSYPTILYGSGARPTYNDAELALLSDVGGGNIDVINFQDTRSVNQTPLETPQGLSVHLKSNATDGVNDGGSFHPILTLRPWHDISGGPYGQITTTQNGNLYWRVSTAGNGSSWDGWQRAVKATELSSYSLTSHNHDSVYAKTATANTYNGEQKFQNSSYCPTVTDTASGVGCAFKASRGMTNELLVDKLIMTASTGKIPFYKYTGTSGGSMTGLTEVASISSSGALTATGGGKISGRYAGGGDDEGLVIGRASNNYAGLCLGEPSGVRSVFYLMPDNSAVWRYNNGSSSYDIKHPGKAGTIALTSDIVAAAGGIYTVDLWTNNSPTSTFNEQTVPYSTTITENDLVAVCFRQHQTNANEIWAFGRVGSASRVTIGGRVSYNDSEYSLGLNRAFTANTSNITFNNASRTTTINNATSTGTVLIPVKVIAFKGVL